MKRFAPEVPRLQLLTFRVGAEEFGLELDAVQEVLPARGVTVLHRAPEFVAGGVELHGLPIPVIDLRRRLELPHRAEHASARLIVAKLAEGRIALVVDSVTEVLAIPETSLSPPPPYLERLGAEHIRSIAQHEERLILVIDLAGIFSAEERIALEQAAAWIGTDADAFSA